MDLTFTDEEAAFAAEVRAWLAANLELPPRFDDVDAEVAWGRSWQARLAAGRWVGIHWPEEFGGRGASPVHVAIFNTEYGRARAPQPVNRVGINLAGPTLLAHGTPEQKQRWVGPILTAEELWCQLFSEPDAGSDLASLRTTATPVEGGWVLNGQKVWTSYAKFARWGICLARTDPDAKKHAGISFLVVDMLAPGIEIRPLVQITGEAEFNEVFLTDVFVPDDHLVGGLHHGWAVANTTLAHERGTNFPFKEQVVHETFIQELFELALDRGALDDAHVAADLVQSFVDVRVLRLHNWRTLSRLARGEEPGAESSWVKLAWTDMTQHLSATALEVLGAEGALAGRWSRQWLWSGAASIAGGTSEIQRTIIGERILGLPRG
ncbi:MAG: acyl-CoA dehydrogenase family protein [Actinomycetota bacterium]|nr:acyl-CoA dehydrogenase family protein [Acidimicrobiia bacterium]MDQ3294804.1 acyl-CoA dehydrogenase family protein [Actinomycetota bacterium]